MAPTWPFLAFFASATAISWLDDFDRNGIVAPLGKLDDDLASKLLGQVNVWEQEGEDLSKQNNATWNMHLFSEVVLQAATDPKVLDAVQQIVGEDIVLMSTALFAKYPHNATGVVAPECLTIIGAHQDRTYWGIEPESQPVVSVWVAVDNATKENGAMQFFPGTHKNKLPHVIGLDECSALADSQGIPEVHLPKNAISAELSSGEYMIFDSRTAHGSGRNEGVLRRVGLTMIYSPAAVHLTETNTEEDWRKPLQVRCAGRSCHERVEL